MKIYYFTQVTSQIEELITLDISPKKYGSLGEHLAYAITAAEKFAKKIHSNNISKAQLNKAIRKVFLKRMHESVLTLNLLKQMPADEFDFTVRDLGSALGKIFILDSPASPIVTDERVELYIPDCPVYLTPIKYGIKFSNDPNWYDINAASQTIFELHVSRYPVSPCTKLVWQSVEEFKKFSIDKTDNEAASDRQALMQLRAISERLMAVSTFIQRNSMLPRLMHQQYAVPPLNLNFNVEQAHQEYNFFFEMATRLRYLQQNIGLGVLPHWVGLGAAGQSSVQHMLAVMEVIRTLEGDTGSDLFVTTLIMAVMVIPNFLINYRMHSASMRYLMRTIGLLTSEQNNQYNRAQPDREIFSEFDFPQHLDSFANYFFRSEQHAPRQQYEELPQNENWYQDIDIDPIVIPNEIRNNPPQSNGWFLSRIVQRFGFFAPPVEVPARAFDINQDPYEEGRELAARLQFLR
jgi:hypothetical protein